MSTTGQSLDRMLVAIEAIMDAIQNALPGWRVELGFGSDVDGWLAQNVGSKKMVFISLQTDLPVQHDQIGRVIEWRTLYAIWIKRRATKGDAVEAFSEYLAVRDALNSIEAQGVDIVLTGGAPIVGGGYAESQLQIEVS